jgi:hypothetical protein
MGKVLFVGFKGKNNASGKLAAVISSEHLLLTNSFEGLKKDIDSAGEEYARVILFGVDKTLTSSVRIEKSAAKDDKKRNSKLDLPDLIESIKAVEIEAEVSDNPKNSLCNDAYWQALTKYAGRAVFIHIPTIKYADEMFLDKLKRVFTS